MKKVGDEFEIMGLVDMGDFTNSVNMIQKGRQSFTFIYNREALYGTNTLYNNINHATTDLCSRR